MKLNIFLLFLSITSIAYASPSNNSIYCPICELVITEAESYLTNNKTEQQLMTYLDSFCDKLPSGKKDLCENIVQQGIPKVFEYIQEKEDPQTVCTQLKLCDPSSHCSYCKLMVNEIEDFLGHNNTLNSIIDHKNAFCIGRDKICEEVVDSHYAEVIIRFVEQDMVHEICHDMELCE